MRIVELRAENYKRLKAINIRPDGSLVEITGANGQGKSSALEAISVALRGRAAAPPQPIRAGEDQCTIRLDMGELVVVRNFAKTEAGEITTKLTVTRGDGSRIKESPQAVLDAICGALAFDPLEFSRWPAKQQFDAMRRFVPGFDFDEYDRAQKADYEARTDQNRMAERAQAAADKIILPPGPKPEAVVIADLLAEIDKARSFNSELATRKQRRADIAAEIDNKRDEAETLRARAATLEKGAYELEAKLSAADELPAPVDDSPFRAKLASAEQTNTTIRAHEERERHLEAANAAKAASEKLTKAREAAKTVAIAAAKMPTDGLDLVDGQVLLNGLPFGQAGTAERIRASMEIAMALNPELRIVLIDEGSELDAASMAMVADIATKRDFQIWMTRVDDSGQVGIVIEAGEVQSVNKGRRR